MARAMIRQRRTRIVATLGPASRSPAMVLALAQGGVDVFRLNFSHGAHESHAETLAAVRAAEAAIGRPVAALADLQGPYPGTQYAIGVPSSQVALTFGLEPRFMAECF